MFKHTKTLVPVVLSAIINLGASILLAQRIGLVGVILGTIIGNVTTTVIYLPWVLKKILPIHPLAELLKIIGSFIVPALVMGTAYFISVHYVSSIWLQLALGTLNFAVYAVLVYLLVLTTEERKFLLEKISRLYERIIPSQKLV
jgi:O-antigen/teichoic acid export membrane protein